jgi:hypothetical protein
MAEPRVRTRVLRRFARLVVLSGALVVAACGSVNLTPAPASPTDFAGLVGRLAVAKISVDQYVSGDAGCLDFDLVPTAISFHAQGLDQATPVKLYLYVFRNRASWDKLRATVATCAQSFVTDPGTFDEIDQSPYILAGQGPWAAQFKAALRTTLEIGAGTGG